MFMFVMKDTKGTRILLLWALRLSFIQSVVMIVVYAQYLSEPGWSDQDVQTLQGLIVVCAISALLNIHYMMVARRLVKCAPRNAPPRQ